jgi:hypothetical protein
LTRDFSQWQENERPFPKPGMGHMKVSVGDDAFPKEHEIEVDRPRRPPRAPPLAAERRLDREERDRKSTRLNSSHT